MIYFDENKRAYAFEIENPICAIEESLWAQYAGKDNWDIVDNGFVDISDTEEYKENLIKKERKYLDTLSLTAADVERAIYKAKGIDFEDILELAKNSPDIDVKALKIELKANNFYRGNPYISQIGTILGFSEMQLDEFFKNGNHEALLAPHDKQVTQSLSDCSTLCSGALLPLKVSNATLEDDEIPF